MKNFKKVIAFSVLAAAVVLPTLPIKAAHAASVVPQVAPIAKPEVKPQVLPQVRPEVKPQVLPAVQPKVQPQVLPAAANVVHPEVKPHIGR